MGIRLSIQRTTKRTTTTANVSTRHDTGVREGLCSFEWCTHAAFLSKSVDSRTKKEGKQFNERTNDSKKKKGERGGGLRVRVQSLVQSCPLQSSPFAHPLFSNAVLQNREYFLPPPTLTHGANYRIEIENYLRAVSPSAKGELTSREGLGLLLDPLLDGQGRLGLLPIALEERITIGDNVAMSVHVDVDITIDNLESIDALLA
jgi:hypothetical protein